MRTTYCGLVSEKLLGQTVTLMGWAHRRRDHGGVIFIDLRDREGMMQVVIDPDTPEAFRLAEDVRSEFVLKIEGLVRRVIVAPTDGFIKEATARAGDTVRAGDLLAALDDRDLVLQRLRWVTERQQHVYEYDKALASIRQQVEAARKARSAAIVAAQRDLAPAQYGSAARSSANRQLLATYHNSVLIEIEELLILSESAAQWAADRYQARPN